MNVVEILKPFHTQFHLFIVSGKGELIGFFHHPNIAAVKAKMNELQGDEEFKGRFPGVDFILAEYGLKSGRMGGFDEQEKPIGKVICRESGK